MNRETVGQTDRNTRLQFNRPQKPKQTYVQTHRLTDRQTDIRTYRQTDRRIDIQTDLRRDGQSLFFNQNNNCFYSLQLCIYLVMVFFLVFAYIVVKWSPDQQVSLPHLPQGMFRRTKILKSYYQKKCTETINSQTHACLAQTGFPPSKIAV